MKTLRDLITVILSLGLPFLVTADSDYCSCGYGGLCVLDPFGYIGRLPCSVYCALSSGFYDEDCHSIINYCISSPCSGGICVPTFGSYFCRCPKGVYGRDCEIDEEQLRNSGLSQELYVYHQRQPWRSSGPNYFTVVFDPSGNVEENDVKKNWIMQLIVNVSDGRSYHPRISDFEYSEVKLKCLEDANKNPVLRDPRVCDLLPNGNVSTFSVDSSYFGPELDESIVNVVKIPGLGNVGQAIQVSLYLYLINLWNHTKTVQVLSAHYNVFNYIYYRAPHNCIMELSFTHCSSDHRYPYVHSRGSDISIDVIHQDIGCTGRLIIDFEWRIQRHTDSLYPVKGKDFVPVTLSNGATQSMTSVNFRPHFFIGGIHMLQYVLKLRGNPPHYGGSDEFDLKAECWIKVFVHEPRIEVRGGNVQTVSCHKTMILELMNLNPDVDINELVFETTCNDTRDKECDRQVFLHPFITKKETKCNSYLQITVIPQFASFGLVVKPLNINIHFIESAASIKVECLHNCYPINPMGRTILAAMSERYLPFNVTWQVTLGNQTIKERDGEINAFLPASATRILRMNSNRFKREGALYSNVYFKAQIPENHQMRAEVSTLSDNLETNLGEFKLLTIGQGVHRFERFGARHSFSFPPVRYSVRQIKDTTESDAHVELLETNYEELLIFSPFWRMVQLCVYNTYNHIACTSLKRLDQASIPLKLTVTDLAALLGKKDYYEFYKKMFIFLWDKTLRRYDPKSRTIVSKWSISVNERLEAARLLIQEPKFKEVVNSNLALRSAVRLLYCKLGNELAGPYAWIDEDFSNDPKSITVWLQVRNQALITMETLINERYDAITSFRGSTTTHSLLEFQEFRRLCLLGMSLAFILNNDKRLLVNSQENPSILRRIQEGIWTFWLWKNDYIFSTGYNSFNKLLAMSNVLFHSIDVFGGKFSRVWSIRTTYVGVLEAFKKGSPRDPFKETISGAADYIFGPEKDSVLDTWLEPLSVELPPVTVDWEFLELILVAVAAKNREGDFSVSPVLVIELRTTQGKTVHGLPDSKSINITLPRMEGGKLMNEPNHDWFVDYLPNSTRSGSTTLAYKIALPVEFNVWSILIRTDRQTSLKARVFDKVPDNETLMASPSLIPLFDPAKGNFYTSIEVLPQEGEQFIPHYFYLGIALPFPEGAVSFDGGSLFSLQSTVDVCIMKRTTLPLEKAYICRGLQSDSGDESIIRCNCDNLGLFQAMTFPITITKLMLDQIQFQYPLPFSYYNAVVVGILAIFLVLTSFYVRWKDRQSRRYNDSLIYLNDNYPADEYVVVIGVYTGSHLYAGTKSKVAIKLIGELNSSRVHLLSVSGRNTLRTGQDDWFLMYVNQPLGRLKSIHFWTDYREVTGWYCSHIVVHDQMERGHYVADIGKWLVMKLLEDVPRVEIAEVKHLEMMEDGPFELTKHSFITNYWTELRNTHHELSFFLVQERYIFNYHIKSCILFVKVLAINLWIWFFQEVAYEWTHGRYLDPVSTRRMLGLSKELCVWAFWAALLSHPITFCIEYTYKCSHLSGSLQKRTTNPLYTSYGTRGSAASKTSPSFIEHNLYNQSGVVGWKKHFLLAFGPCQFRCVDSNKELITLKTARLSLIVRGISCALIAIMFIVIFGIEFSTDYQLKSKTCAVVVVIAFLLDAIFLGPFLILVRTFIAFYILDMNNRERFMLRKEMREPPAGRGNYLEYLQRVLGKEYKPLLSTEMAVLKKKKMIHILSIKVLNHVLLGLSFIAILSILLSKFSKEDYYMIRTLGNTMESTGHPEYVTSEKTIDEVHDIISAVDFVVNAVADFTDVWYNGQLMKASQRAPNVRWALDHYGQCIGSSSVLLLLQNDDGNENIPFEFDDYFTKIHGPFSVSSAKTEPISRGGTMEYTTLSSSWIYGAVASYPFAGYLRIMPLVPWETFYSQMRILMDDFVVHEEDDCRALIISTNFVYPFVSYVVTVDVIIEFHESGTGEAHTHVQGIKITSEKFIERTILYCTSAYFIVQIIASMYRTGVRRYFDRAPKVLGIIGV
ncbi:hypothetical protein GE061_015069 [Apolygus lucorum]|uniref:PLAT domain-containing protein n=1 Tax=Apolygus lucorum TaxID=248454 RepID=A0A8S9XJZ4_APOLU|nr:hypothetical protein GE061_015069 [Apolygus lucorum]